MSMKVALGGTFNVLHRGHRALLDRAFECGDEVLVGITSDAMARRSKSAVRPLEQRIEALESYLRTRTGRWSVMVIDRPDEHVDVREDLSVLVVSPETLATGGSINRGREARGLRPLRLELVPHVLAGDFLPISARRIAAGEIDAEGRLLRPLRVRVGSLNPVKIEAVRRVLSMSYDQLEVTGVDVSSGVPEQPRGEETRKGAMERASRAIGDADLGIGLEAGVFETTDGLYDMQYCAVVDRRGLYSIGHGMGFRYPPAVAEMVRDGSTVGAAFKKLYGSERDGRKDGAIGFLTRGALDRTALAEQAVTAAMVPRTRAELYPDL
ncbi:MAG: inosine/xanthosine triphosphatase [Methanomassiliicoccus sp.]|nr:inosine/xanthosine triphosphatase [Methanomassiliicoccus sp.]